MTVAIARAVPGTSRRDQLRAIAIREARAAPIWLDIFHSWRRVVTADTFRDARRGGGLDVNLFTSLMDLEVDRRVDQLVRSLTGPILRADLDDFTTPLGPLTIETLAQNQIGDLVVDLSARQRANLREQLVSLFAEGPTDDILQGIAASTGLTARQTRSVQNLRRRLIRDGIPRGTAVRRAQEHAGRLLRRRARLIARTEAVRFTSLIVEERAKTIPGMLKQWVSARDGNVDEICVSLDNDARIGPKDLFQGLSGAIARPPAHPGCRCVLELSKAKLKPGRRKPKRRRPPRPRRVPIVEPPPPPPPPRPVGDARSTAQVGAELEKVGERGAAIRAQIEKRKQDLFNRLAPVNTRQLKILSRKNELRNQAGLRGLDEIPDSLRLSAEWSSLTAEALQIEKRLLTLNTRIIRTESRLTRVHQAQKRIERRVVARSSATRTVGKFPIGTKDPEFRRRRQQGVDDFRELVSDRWLRGRTVKINSMSVSRSFAEPNGREVKIAGWAREESVVHELGHALEFNHPEILEASLRFYDRRTAGEALRAMPFTREQSRFDAFIDPYVGRDYARTATEVLSMGIEYMSRSPLEFWQKDPDHFAYIWDILRGRVPQ